MSKTKLKNVATRPRDVSGRNQPEAVGAGYPLVAQLSSDEAMSTHHMQLLQNPKLGKNSTPVRFTSSW